jgi:hypothetical protein
MTGGTAGEPLPAGRSVTVREVEEFTFRTRGVTTMMRLRCAVVVVLVLALAGMADAKWWIFGQSESEISTRYLYLNGVSYDELGSKVVLYRETLESGQVTLRGKAAASASAVGSVQVSINNRETWDKAQKAADGSFEYSFRPESGRTYIFYVKVIDTAGKTNDVEATRKEVTISDQNISALIRQAMDELIAAYKAEDLARFMALVGEGFAPDQTVLERAIRKDFTLFNNIDLRYTLNNVTAASGKVFASFSYSRAVTSSLSNKTLSDRGISEFVFVMGAKGPQIVSMKNPLVFGLSDAAGVATGNTNTGSNDPIILVTARGDVITEPYATALQTIANEGVPANSVEVGSFQLTVTCQGFNCNYPGFFFATGEVVPFGGDINLETNLFFMANGVGYQDLGSPGIANVTHVPAGGYTMGPGAAFQAGPNVGHTFAFVVNGKFALLEVVSYSDQGNGNTSSTYRYRYQPDGTTSFPR